MKCSFIFLSRLIEYLGKKSESSFEQMVLKEASKKMQEAVELIDAAELEISGFEKINRKEWLLKSRDLLNR